MLVQVACSKEKEAGQYNLLTTEGGLNTAAWWGAECQLVKGADKLTFFRAALRQASAGRARLPLTPRLHTQVTRPRGLAHAARTPMPQGGGSANDSTRTITALASCCGTLAYHAPPSPGFVHVYLGPKGERLLPACGSWLCTPAFPRAEVKMMTSYCAANDIPAPAGGALASPRRRFLLASSPPPTHPIPHIASLARSSHTGPQRAPARAALRGGHLLRAPAGHPLIPLRLACKYLAAAARPLGGGRGTAKHVQLCPVGAKQHMGKPVEYVGAEAVAAIKLPRGKIAPW